MLDLTPLSDDQLLDLMRALIREVETRRAPLMGAMRDAMLTEAERTTVARAAAEQAAAALRAAERERISREAAERVRAQHASANAAAEAERIARAAQEARDRATANDLNLKAWLTRAACLVGRSPAAISILLTDTNFGRRVMINEGADRYARDHLADYYLGTKSLKTTRDYIKSKPDIAAFCAEFAATYPSGTKHFVGANVVWEQ